MFIKRFFLLVANSTVSVIFMIKVTSIGYAQHDRTKINKFTIISIYYEEKCPNLISKSSNNFKIQILLIFNTRLMK